MYSSSAALIRRWLEQRLEKDSLDWLDAQVSQVPEMTPTQIERAIAMAGRKVGKADLSLSEEELSEARNIRPDWRPVNWSVADAARALLLLPLTFDAAAFGETFKRICQTADLAALISLYRGTALFPQSEALDWQIGEGLRTSIPAVFEAIAHHNPVPAARFPEHRWNHMVLKTLFIDSTLKPIIGLDERRNSALAATLVDHIHERRAAGRAIDLQVWRCIAPFARGAVLDDIAPLADSPERAERLAAVLCLLESPDPMAAELLDKFAEERQIVASGAVSWNALGD